MSIRNNIKNIITYTFLFLSFLSLVVGNDTSSSQSESEPNQVTSGEKATVIIYYTMTFVLILACFLFINSKL